MRALLLLTVLASSTGLHCRAGVTAMDDGGRSYSSAGEFPDAVMVAGKVFASGFHKIQSMAWRGRKLWVANSPDLTVVLDLDGDGTADEYVLMAHSLGDGDHGLHGIAWGADGKLYLATGNLAAMPVKQLGRAMKFHRGEYAPSPSRLVAGGPYEGAVLRCDADGRGLEIVERGMGNPQAVEFDDTFHLLLPDNKRGAEPGDHGEAEKRQRPHDQWTFEELAEDLGASIAARSVAAQEELMRRGESVKVGMLKWLERGGLSKRQRTWALWTLGRAGKDDVEIEAWFAAQPLKSTDANTRAQCLRIIAYRIREFGFSTQVPPSVVAALHDAEPQVRRESVEALRLCRQSQYLPALVDLVAGERDDVTLDLACRVLAEMADDAALQTMRADQRPGIQAALARVMTLWNVKK